MNEKTVTIEQIVDALTLAGIHAADCPEGKRNYNQKYTGMYLTHRKCECWVGSPEDDDKGRGYVCD